jgi:hypothetical protein
MKKPPKSLGNDAELVAAMKNAILGVLTNKNADVVDVMKAVDVASKLLMIEHKIKGSGDQGKNFFG